jgi:hypothetical protein
MDAVDNRDPIVSPQFACAECGAGMYPEYYQGVHGYEYRIEDVRPGKPDAERTENVTP